jgi:hypothetical protein
VSTFWETRIAPFLNKYCLALCVCLVGIGCLRVVSTYSALSLTVDEPSHFACGMEYLENHKYTFLREQPPLSRAMEALGPYLAGSRLSGLQHTQEDRLTLLARSPNFDRTVFLMRLGNLPFFVLACAVVCTWSWWMFDKATAVVATGLFTLLPTVLADAGLATTDMALGATVGAAFLAGIFWAERPSWLRSVLLGVCVALAVLSKFTALGYVPLTLGFALGCYLLGERQGMRPVWTFARAHASHIALVFVISALVVWAGYWFSFGPLGHTKISVPAPAFFLGIRDALGHDRHGHPAFLLGHFRRTGWWYYFPVALALKTPIAFLVALVPGTWVCLKKRARPTYLFPLGFTLGILLPAMAGRIDVGVRHIEPIYIGLSIIAAVGLVRLCESSRTGAGCALTAGLLVWMVVSVAFHHPDYLAYFNELAGKNPQQVLVDSNYDWGQDLKLLSTRLNGLGVKQFSLLTLDGVRDPQYLQKFYGLPPNQDVDDAVPALGWNVVSPTMAETVRLVMPERPTVANPWYMQIPATERVGPLLLYNITPDVRDRFVREVADTNQQP